MELEFEINNQSMNRIDKNKPADFSNKYLLCKFNFLSNDWSEDFTKFAIFKTNNANYRVTILEDECYVPFDVLEHRRFVITVYGVNAEDVRITTNQVWLRLEDSGFVTSYDESGEFNPDMTEQIWLAMDEKSDISYVDTGLSLKADKEYVDSELDLKADKLYVDSEFESRDVVIGLKADKVFVDTSLDGKVDKITGKGLSTNDFTEYYKNFLDGFDGDIEAFLEEHKEEIEALITSEVLDGKADKVHSHLKSDISDFSHTHTEADITDLQDYALASDVYSKAEVDELIYNVENKFFVTSDAPVIQTGDNLELYAKMKSDGFPVTDKTVHFYQYMPGVIYYHHYNKPRATNVDIGVSEYKVEMKHIDDGTGDYSPVSIIGNAGEQDYIDWKLENQMIEIHSDDLIPLRFEGDSITIKNNTLYYGENTFDLSNMDIDLNIFFDIFGEVTIKELEEE